MRIMSTSKTVPLAVSYLHFNCFLKLVVELTNLSSRAEVVIVGQKWLYSGKSGPIRTKWLYSDKLDVFGQNSCNRAKVVVLGQSGCVWAN